MTSIFLHIAEKLRKDLTPERLNSILEACSDSNCVVPQEMTNKNFLEQFKQKNEIFLIGNTDDLIYFSKRKTTLINENFILIQQNKVTSDLTDYKEYFKKIRFVIGEPAAELLKVSISHILKFKINHQKAPSNICSHFIQNDAQIFEYILRSSLDRAELQDKVSLFFTEQIEKNQVKLLAGSTSYAKNLADILDEFLMNAIWDANPEMRELDRTKPIQLSEKTSINVTSIFNHSNFVLSVTDQFGTFEASVIYKYIQHSLGVSEPTNINEGIGGAGLGLFMIMQKIGFLVFEVEKGVLTRATAIGRGDQSIRDMQRKPRTILFFEKK